MRAAAIVTSWILLLAMVSGCLRLEATPPAATPSVVAQAATQAPTQLAASTAAHTATAIATRRPTSTPFPTYAPYAKIPEVLDDGWKTGSLSAAGIDGVKLSEMLAAIYHGDQRGDQLESMYGGKKIENIHGILIARRGKLVFEEYFYHYDRSQRHNLASVTKSVTSLLVGIAIQQGLLESVEQRMLMFYKQYQPLPQPDERRERITIQDLLTMRIGMDCDDWSRTSPTYHKTNYYLRPPDLVEWTLHLRMLYEPGEQFFYCSVGTVLLGGILDQVTEEGLKQFSKQYLFAPLGISSFFWMMVPGGWVDTAGSMEMRMRDMLKLGQLMLQGGEWQGQQVVPQAWIEESLQQHVRLESSSTWGKGYGYLWWLNDTPLNRGWRKVFSFSASGAGGQVITVFPELEMVVVITGGNYDPDPGEPFKIMEQWILPAVVR